MITAVALREALRRVVTIETLKEAGGCSEVRRMIEVSTEGTSRAVINVCLARGLMVDAQIGTLLNVSVPSLQITGVGIGDPDFGMVGTIAEVARDHVVDEQTKIDKGTETEKETEIGIEIKIKIGIEI
jgi:hypothetical protein